MSARRVRGGSKSGGRQFGAAKVPAQHDKALSAASDSIPPPPGLEAYTFQVAGDEYALLSFELPALTLPRGLSPAERAVVIAVASGQTNAQIAKARGTSSNTVANQLRSIYGKLKVGNRMELIRLCARGADD